MPVLPEISFDAGQKQQLRLWLQNEISQTRADRAPLDLAWSDFIAQWRSKLPQGDVEFPWPGASNIEVPITALHSDPVYSELIQTIHGPEDLWNIKARTGERAPLANSLRKLLTRLDNDYLRMRQVNQRAFLDLAVLGTAVYKTHWQHSVRKIRDYNPDNRQEIITRRKVTSQPKVEPVPLQHFWIPANSWNIDPDHPVGGAQWVAHQFWMTANELSTKVEDGHVEPGYDRDAVEFVRTFEKDKQTHEEDSRVDKEIQRQDEYEPFHDFKIELFEVWARFDVDGDGIEEDVVLVWHQESMTILRALHMPHLHGKRPFDAAQYLPNFGFYGIGLGEADEWAQGVVSMLTNGLINNVVLANSRMFVGPLGSSVDPNEPIHPGKFFFVDQGAGEDIGSVQMGDIYPSLPSTIDFIMQVADLRTGVPELRQGDISGLPSRTPATTVLETLRLGNKRFDMILGNLRDEQLGNIGMKVLQLFAQYLREDPVRWTSYLIETLGEDEGIEVRDALMSVSPAELPNLFGITITAASAVSNKEAEKQSLLGLIQILAQVMPQLLELMQFIEQQPEGTPSRQVAERMFTGGVELLGRLVDKFDFEDTEDLVPDTRAIMQMLNASQNGQNAALAPMMQQLGAGGGGGPAGAQSIPPGADLGALFGL